MEERISSDIPQSSRTPVIQAAIEKHYEDLNTKDFATLLNARLECHSPPTSSPLCFTHRPLLLPSLPLPLFFLRLTRSWLSIYHTRTHRSLFLYHGTPMNTLLTPHPSSPASASSKSTTPRPGSRATRRQTSAGSAACSICSSWGWGRWRGGCE